MGAALVRQVRQIYAAARGARDLDDTVSRRLSVCLCCCSSIFRVRARACEIRSMGAVEYSPEYSTLSCVDGSCLIEKWWPGPESNQRHADFQSGFRIDVST